MGLVRMELKVCEGCGTLWVRPSTQETVYCAGCSRLLAEFPAPRKRKGLREPVGRRGGCAAAKPRLEVKR